MIGARVQRAMLLLCGVGGIVGIVGACADEPGPATPVQSAGQACEPAPRVEPAERPAPSASLAQRLGGKVEQVVEACKATDPLARDPAVDARVAGRWTGEYAYEDGRKTEIEAEIRVVDGALSGDMDEPNTQGVVGYSRLSSSLFGDVYAGRKVVFTKMYETGDATHSVLYTGILAESGDRIEGRWRTRGVAGSFWLQRG